MQLSELRDVLQPDLDQDFDALYTQFVEGGGSGDLRAFIAHIHGFGHIDDAVYDKLMAMALSVPAADETPTPPQWTGGATAPFKKTGRGAPLTPETPTPAPEKASEPEPAPAPQPVFDDFEDEDVTVVAHDEDFAAMRAEIEAKARGETPAAAEPAGRPAPPERSKMETGADIGTGEYIAEEDKHSRTMFRRSTGGGLKETGKQTKKKRKKRRKKGDPQSDPVAEDPDRYDYLGTVGEGAMGRIILANDKKLHRKVAFKAMSDEIADHATLADKFKCEAQITAQLDHPNIVPVYNLESKSAYTMKLIKGRTVEDIILECIDACMKKRPQDAMSLTERLELFLRACDAMHYANCRGVVHRDLKPENIMVGEFNELYVMDWGIARLMKGDFEDQVDLGDFKEEEGDFIIGTPGYMSPEQADGMNDDLTGASDQYSLGLILFELVSLRQAVTGKKPIALVTRHQEGEKDPLKHLGRDKIPSELAAIVHKATHVKPARRYGDIRELSEDLKRFMRGDAVLAKPDNIIQGVLRWMGRHRQATAAAVMSMLGFLTLVTMVMIIYAQVMVSGARARQQKVSNLLTMVARQGSLIDGQFLKYEGLLSVIATTAVDNLQRGVQDQPAVFMATDFDSEVGGIGLIDSRRYNTKVSIKNPAYVLPTDVRAERVKFDMERLGALRKHYYKVLLRSHSEDAATYTPKRAERALTDVGVPIAWAYVGLDNGVFSVFPGHGAYPDGFDHRDSPWYELASGTHGPKWGAPSLDLTGLGLVLTCAQALYTDDDQALGVAGVDVTFDYIIEELLVAEEFAGKEGIEAFLLDAEGKIVIRSSKAGKEFKGANTGKQRQIRMPDFHHEEIVEAIQEKRSGGQIEARGPEGMEMVIYTRMHSIGWYYVLAGDVGEVLEIE